MKKIFTISAAVVMASSVISTAQTLSSAFEGRSNAAPKFVTEALKNGNLPTREVVPVQMDKRAREMSMIKRADESSSAAKIAAATAAGENPFYLLTDGTYYVSTVLGPGQFASYYNTMLVSQAYNATFKPVVGKLWTSSGPSNADLSEYINADGNLFLSDWGIGGYYAPAISNDEGGARYYAGAYNPDKKNDYTVLYSATETEPLAFGIYNLQENGGYTGYTDTYGYGTMTIALDDAGEKIATSSTTMIDFGKPQGGSLLIDHIEFVGVSKSGEPLKDGATLNVLLITTDDEGNEEVHTGLITADDIASISGTLYYVSASFFKDEDGFQAAYTPVINNDFQLYITGFDKPNVDLGIFMVYDEGESNTTGAALGYVHHSYFLMDRGEGEHFYRWNSIDALVNLCGYYIGLCEYNTGSKTINGTVGVEGGKVNTILHGNEPEAVDAYFVETTFNIDDLSIYEAPEWVTIGVDTSAYSEYSVICFTINADAITDGSEGRQGDVVIGMSEVEASMTLHIVQGTDAYINGIDNVNVSGAVCNAVVAGDDIVVSCPADVKSVNLYNAAGALVSTVAVENGKAVIKNAPAGLNLVNFNGKQSVKVVK